MKVFLVCAAAAAAVAAAKPEQMCVAREPEDSNRGTRDSKKGRRDKGQQGGPQRQGQLGGPLCAGRVAPKNSLVSPLLTPLLAPTHPCSFITTTGVAGEMAVSWVTAGSAASSEVVAFGTRSGALSSNATGTSSVFTDGGAIDAITIHVATLTGLAAATQYFYQVPGGAELAFTNQPARAGGAVNAILADFGFVNDVAMDALLSQVAAGAFDAVIHAGDLAYNLQDSMGAVGNDFMNAISPAVARVPYYTVPGNHEADVGDSFGNFKARFAAVSQLGASSGSGSNLYYSWTDAAVGAHYVAIDTEMWSYGGTPAEIAAQGKWLEADLAAVDRAATPWVIAYGHKAPWMDKTNWGAYFTTLFAKYNVNIYFCGHTHNYQRTLPAAADAPTDPGCLSKGNSVYTNCTGTAFIVTGSPGCKEKLSTGTAPAGILQTHFQAYGFGALKVNSSHLEWTWTETVQEGGGAAGGELVAVPREAAQSDHVLLVRA